MRRNPHAVTLGCLGAKRLYKPLGSVHFQELQMDPLLSVLASAVAPKNDPREEITQEDAIFDSTLVASKHAQQRTTRVGDGQRKANELLDA